MLNEILVIIQPFSPENPSLLQNWLLVFLYFFHRLSTAIRFFFQLFSPPKKKSFAELAVIFFVFFP